MADTDKNTDINTEEDLTTETENAADKEIAQASEETGAEETVENSDAKETGESSEETPEDVEAGSEETKKSKLFGKKDKKEDKLKEQINELNDKVMRQMAEFDNYRKRTEKEKQQMFETGAKSVIEKILPVVDNFERGFAALPEEEKDSAFAEGMSMVYKQLMTELEKIEVKPIEAIGQEFDPNFHNAVMHVEDESLGENVIVEEFQKGYVYRESVIRHSMVKVAN